MEPTLLETTDGGVLTLTLNRPERRNALDVALITALSARLVAAGEDRAVRCVVLTGAGGAFCAGADLKEAMSGAQHPEAGDVMERAYNPGIRALRRMPKLVRISLILLEF